MKRYVVVAISAVMALAGIAEAQTRTHMDIARAAAYRPGQDFTWIFDRLCFEPAPEPGAAPAPARAGPPPRSVWYDEPAKVFDNLYYFVAKTDSVAGESLHTRLQRRRESSCTTPALTTASRNRSTRGCENCALSSGQVRCARDSF